MTLSGRKGMMACCQNFKAGCIFFLKNDKILEEETKLPNGILVDNRLLKNCISIYVFVYNHSKT
jgi:hypothetical protein